MRVSSVLFTVFVALALLPMLVAADAPPAGGNCTSGAVNPLCTEGGDCIISASCWMHGQHAFTSLAINSAANITVTPYNRSGYDAIANLSDVASGWDGTGVLYLMVSGDVSIASNSFILATGAGYWGGNSTAGFVAGNGRGGGTYCVGTSGGGGGYGGVGTNGWCSTGGPSYGDLVNGASDMGSGGGYGGDGLSGRGGGAIMINATGSLESNGTILANGVDGSSRGGGGSGGGVTLIASTLHWFGGINVSGGAGGSSGPGGNGAGGRVTVNASSNPVVFGTLNASFGNPGTLYSNQPTVGGGDCYSRNYASCVPGGECTISNTCTWFGGHQFTSLLLDATAVVEFYDNSSYSWSTNSTTPSSGYTLRGMLGINATNISLTSSGLIRANGSGYPGGNSSSINGQGRGGGTYCNGNSGGGGGYGGAGSNGWCGVGGPAYGDLTHGGADMGSGGGYGSTGAGGSGGGAVILNATNLIESNGTILANGQFAQGDRSGGGSGGGVTLVAGVLHWFGGINVSGGAGGASGPGGNGSGGRITLNVSTGPVVYGSVNVSTRNAGTLYANQAAAGGGDCYLRNYASCVPGGACTLSNTCTMYGSHQFTALNIQTTVLVSPYDNSSYSWATNITSTYGGYTRTGRFEVNATNITLSNASVINAVGAGYLGGSYLSTMGEGRGGGNNCSTTSGGGGSYGGAGTAGWCSAAGPAYGNLTHGGADMGSGGGFVTNSGGSGGGAIVLNATGRLESNGTILANGQNALSDRSGGGSGGGVTLIAGTLYWLGGINVSGGAGGDSGPAGNGGGGRISAWFDSNQSAIMVNVSGATNIADTAAVGSTYSNNRPFVNLTSPLNSSYGTTLALNFTPSYFNGTTVTCGYALDGVDSEIGSVENNSLNSSSLSGLADGLHSVSVNCTNVTALFAVETTRVAGPIFFTVDATAPYYQDNSTTYPAVYTDSPSTVWLNTSWADGVSLDAVLFEVDGANYTPLADPSDSSIRFLSWAAMAAGDHYWVSYANDTAGNFNATGNMTFSIAQAPVGVTLKANDSTASDQRFNAPNITNITAAFNVSASGVTYELLYNGSASNETLNSTGGPTIVFVWSQLNATVLNFSARLNATQNYSGASASFRVSFPDVIASQYSDVAAAVPEVYDPESVVWLNASWTDNIGVTQVLVELDGTNYSATQDGSVYFLRLDSLAAGDHFWREHANDAFDNYNLTANTTFTIARAPVNATVYTNGSPSNSTQTLIPNVFNFTATKNVSEGVIELITNYTGSDIRLSSTTGASTSFLWNQSNNSGVLVTARYNQTENYSAAGTSMQVTFLTHAPNYTANTSLTPGVFQDGFQHWFNATWTDDVAVAIVLFDIDGVNQTPLQDPSDASKYFVRLGALPSGLHWWQAYANDTAGAMNATGNVTFTTLQAPVNASVYVNDSPANRSTEALILNFTATKNVSEGIIELLYNETGSTLAAGSSQQVYLIWLQGNLSSYQLIARYNATQNYSLSNSSLNITIYDVTSPVVNNASVNESVAYRNNSLLFAANATDLWLGAVWIETNHSGAWANYTIDTGFNSIYNYTIPGLNYSDHEIIGYRFWANDSSGNNASTSIAVFKISNLGAPNGSLLASPANNSIIVYNNATLNWTAATDIDNDTITYLVQSSNDSGFSVVSLNLSFVSTNGFINLNQPGSAINISTPLQAQYWRVAAFDGVAYSEWSDINNATVVFAVISSGIANNSVVRNATAFNLTVTEVQGEAWINNVTATISSTQYQLSDDGNWNYAWTPSYASPQVLHIAFNAYNQTMEDPSVYVTDAIDVRLGRAAGLTQSPIVSSLCPNATYATNGSNVTIQLNYYVDTLSELDYLTLSAPSSYDYNLTPYVSSLSGLNLSRNYSFIANESGNYTLTAYLTDLENQSVTGVSWFYADTAFIMANFSVNGFNLAAERDACGNPLNAASNYTYVRPPGPVDVEANTSALSVLFKSLNLSSNTSFGQALNLSDLLNTAYNVSVPSGYRRVAQFELNSSLENYSYALIVYNYSSIAGSLDNESSLHVFKCSNHSGCSNTTMTNVTATVFTNNQTLVFNTTTFSIYTVAEASSSVVVTVTPTPAPTPTPQVITNTVYSGGGGAYREVSVEKQVLKSVEIISPPLQLSTYSNDTILAPIVLTNAEDVDFHNVSLTASSDSPEHITLEFDKAYYDIIPVGEHRISNLSISTHSPLGVYNVTVTARVGSPNITQSTRIFVDLVERGGQISVNVAETLQFARDLFKQNPECLELSEFLTLAQDELEKGNYEKAKSYVDLSVDSCRDLLARKPGQMQIASNEPPLVAGGYSWQDYAIVAGAALVLLATAFLYLRSRRGKGPKHREHAVAKPSAPEERRERYHPHSRR